MQILLQFLLDTSQYILYEFITRFHVYLQLFLVLIVLWVVFKKSDKKVIRLSKEDEEKIIREWKPEPLVGALLHHSTSPPRIVERKIDKYIYVDGVKCLNLASYNFLGLLTNDASEAEALRAVRKYGIGSCGPRGFYGTVDVHLQLEEDLANFFHLQEAIVYSYGFSAISTAIPAYAKRSDIIFADEYVNFAIQKGIDASRSEIKYFRHNDVEHLHKLLMEQAELDLKNKKKAKKTRKFLIIEGIYSKTGDMCPFPELMVLKKKYKLRLFIDESLTFGVLGKSGRGITQHFGVSPRDVDLIIASMEYSLATVGGFCVGSDFIVEHQRLSGLGYCFSASLPPLLTVTAITNLKSIHTNPTIIQELNNTCKHVHTSLKNNNVIMDNFNISGHELSPVKHLVPKFESSDRFMEHFVNYCQENGLTVCKATYLPEDRPPCLPSIRLAICRSLTSSDVKQAVDTFESALNSYFLSE
uniref:Serine palmitoyltransferase 1 n=1 Tax=Panstrongylus megistus TaxID=65343 RepID=A0A069DUP1_9HEMI